MILLAAACLLAGCATGPMNKNADAVDPPGAVSESEDPSAAPVAGADTVRVRWYMASLAEVNRICNNGRAAIHRKSVWGCYRRAFNECIVYTARPESGEDPQIHDTLGHEVRHCFQGAFHK